MGNDPHLGPNNFIQRGSHDNTDQEQVHTGALLKTKCRKDVDANFVTQLILFETENNVPGPGTDKQQGEEEGCSELREIGVTTGSSGGYQPRP